jgi:hypothetical protein
MKLLLTSLFILISLWGFAQPALPDTNLLDKDPVFRKVLSRRLSYPFSNAEVGNTKLVYAQFSIDEKGHTQNIKILNPASGRYYFINFDRAVEKALKKLPPLQPRYEGKYVLPVIFAINDMQTGKRVIPDNTTFNGKLSENILLKSVTIVGYSRRSPAGSKSEPGKEIFDMSNLKL